MNPPRLVLITRRFWPLVGGAVLPVLLTRAISCSSGASTVGVRLPASFMSQSVWRLRPTRLMAAEAIVAFISARASERWESHTNAKNAIATI